MTISGEGIKPCNIEVPLGTSFQFIVDQLGGLKGEIKNLFVEDR